MPSFLDSEKAGGSSIDCGFSHSGCRGKNIFPSPPAHCKHWNNWAYPWEVTCSRSLSLAEWPTFLMGTSDDLDSIGSEDTPFQPVGGN